MADNYRTGPIPADCKFFVKLIVRSDRTIETNATLYSCGKNAKPLHTFLVRARGGTPTKGMFLFTFSFASGLDIKGGNLIKMALISRGLDFTVLGFLDDLKISGFFGQYFPI